MTDANLTVADGMVVNLDFILLDFNHPLAGETLHSHVRIAALRPATREELAEPPELREE